MYRLIFLLIFLTFSCFINSFEVVFRENYNVKIEKYNTQIYKRELSHFFDKAAYTFNGLTKIESVPVVFPLDICVLNVEGIKYAAALHKAKNGIRQFAVFKMMNRTYVNLLNLVTPIATSLDCKSFAGRGYIALAFNITQPIGRANEGSPIFEIASQQVRVVQYFAAPNLRAMYLRAGGNELTLLQAYENTKSAPNLYCPYFKWTGTTFNRLGRIPCNNARRLEPFTIDYESYVAVANYADEYERTTMYSEIYKYNMAKHKFQLFQRIRTQGAVDVKYFNVPHDEVQQKHFLIFANSIGNTAQKAHEADSVFYIYDKGQFVPYQRLTLYAVERFLPVQNSDPEKFLLLVACKKQDIKIYNFNDWHFEQSNVQFTEGAFSRGVAKMRTYMENGESYLVISNELMLEQETNIFLPIFKQEEHVNALRQQIIDWARIQTERLTKVDVYKLNEQVQQKLQQLQTQIQTKPEPMPNVLMAPHLHTVETTQFVYAPHNLSSNYWEALGYTKRALDVLERKFVKKRLARSAQPPQIDEYHFEHMKVDTLVVRDKINAARINGIDTKTLKFEQMNAKKIYVSGSYKKAKSKLARQFVGATKEDARDEQQTDDDVPDADDDEFDVLHVEHLKLDGRLNGYTWQDLYNNTLKRKADLQFVKAPMHIEGLETEAFVVTNNKLNERNLSELISIDGGDYSVQQDVQFAAPLKVKDLQISERLNHLHVHDNKFDVLLKRANYTQVIRGEKHFEQLTVKEPITAAGKLLGPQLIAMAPLKVLHDELYLVGNYTIAGNVTIGDELNAGDIIIESQNLSMKTSLDNAIDMTAVIENVQLNFTQPIVAENAHVTHINGRNMEKLLKLNTDEVQIVEGTKYIPNNLEITQGLCEVKIINGIDVEELPQQYLLKDTNQTIEVPVRIGKLNVSELHAKQIKLAQEPLDAYLTSSGAAQHIKGNIIVDKLNVSTINVQYLNTNGEIYGHKVEEIYQHKTKNSPNLELLLQPGKKFYGNIYVKNLWLNGSINNVNVAEVQRQMALLSGNIKYVGDFTFKNDVHIDTLTFADSLNGIKAADFGQIWLTKTGEQNFTAPQTFAAVTALNGVQLNGALNGIPLQAYEEYTYRTDRAELLPAVYFENSIEMNTVETPTINGLNIPGDMLYRHSAAPQVLQAPLHVHGSVHVTQGIHNTTNLNAFDLEMLAAYLSGVGYDTLHVEHAYFQAPPDFQTLNQRNLTQLLDKVWLANENIELNWPVEIHNATFNGLLEYNSNIINNVNLNELKETYFSLTRPQQITGTFNFMNDVTFNELVEATDVQHHGPLVESVGNTTFYFNDFVQNTLKTSGPHNVTGQWKLNEAFVMGDIKNVHINNLNFAEDVMLLNMTNPIISGTKYVKNLIVKKLYAHPRSIVAGVPIAHWINDAVYIYGNHTISGITTLQTVHIYNDLKVGGLVNGIKFNEHNLLLRDREQIIQGDLEILNIRGGIEQPKSILVANIDRLNVERINDMPVDKLYANLAQNLPNLHIKGHLVFKQPLTVTDYNIGQLERQNNEDQHMARDKPHNDCDEMDAEELEKLRIKIQKIKNQLKTNNLILEHFELHQRLPLNASDLMTFTLSLENDQLLDVIGIIQSTENGNESSVTYYTWDLEREEFVQNDTLNWLPQDKHHLRLLKLSFNNGYALLAIYKALIKVADKLLNEAVHVVSLRPSAAEGYCYAIYGTTRHNSSVSIHCLTRSDTANGHDSDKNTTEITYNLELLTKLEIDNVEGGGGVKQLLTLSKKILVILNYAGNRVQLWQLCNKNYRKLQTLNASNAHYIASGAYFGTYYLAVISAGQAQNGSIEIYSSEDGKNYTIKQKITCATPVQQAYFKQPPKSLEFLLYLLTEQAQPLLIYQYQPDVGVFQQRLSTTILPAAVAHGMYDVQLMTSDRQLTAVQNAAAVYFVETVLRSHQTN